MQLKALVKGLGLAWLGADLSVLSDSADFKKPVEITDICYDSRRVGPGALFCCLPGQHTDGHAFAADALARGAAALVVQHPLPPGVAPGTVPVLQAADTRLALAALACRFYRDPAREMTMLGVTGTKGKTTTAHLIAAILTAAGRRVGLVGTNGVSWPGHHHDLNHTTPESSDLQQLLRQLADAGCDACVMEVSSQGLKMERVAGIFYEVGVFTNLYPDHIGPGEHPDFADYLACKARLFRRCRVGVVNADDPHTPALLARHTCQVVRYGMAAPGADCRSVGAPALLRSQTILGVAFTLALPGGVQGAVQVGMPGAFSVYNALAAAAAAHALGVDLPAIQAGLQSAVVKGRVELVPISREFTVLLDYAHNENAAQSLLQTLRAYHPGRLVVVFGCGGNRSRLRRYGMGAVCARLADFCIVTEDNNRFEPVEEILADIRTGMARGNPATPYVMIPDRLEALHYAIDHAVPGDIIAIIGKGHETYRDCQGVKTPFLERELLEEYAAEKGVV